MRCHLSGICERALRLGRRVVACRFSRGCGQGEGGRGKGEGGRGKGREGEGKKTKGKKLGKPLLKVSVVSPLSFGLSFRFFVLLA